MAEELYKIPEEVEEHISSIVSNIDKIRGIERGEIEPDFYMLRRLLIEIRDDLETLPGLLTLMKYTIDMTAENLKQIPLQAIAKSLDSNAVSQFVIQVFRGC